MKCIKCPAFLFSDPVFFSFVVTLLCCILLGSFAAQDGAAEIQGGGGDVENSSTSEHRALLRLFRRDAESKEKDHRSRYRAYDVWNS